MSDPSCCPSVLSTSLAGSPQVDLVRRAAFAALRMGTAPRLAEIAAATGLGVEKVRRIVGVLLTAGIATVEGDVGDDATVVGAEGLTVRKTSHRLGLGGVGLHTWCAFDTIGIPAALRADAVARTACPACGAGIELVLSHGVPPDSVVVGWWPQATAGPVKESFCPTANLFCTRAHLDAWRVTSSSGSGQALPLPALAECGRITWALFAGAPGQRP